MNLVEESLSFRHLCRSKIPRPVLCGRFVGSTDHTDDAIIAQNMNRRRKINKSTQKSYSRTTE